MTRLGVEVTVTARAALALASTVARTVRPRRPDPRWVAQLEPVGAPRARRGVTLHAITQNEFGALTAAVAQGRLRPAFSPMTVGAFLVEHPEARFLVDAGVCHDARRRHVPRLPALGRALLAGSPPRVGLADGVREAGFDPDGLAFVLLTHLHWDHCSGLAELPGVPVRLSRAEYEFAAAPPDVLLRHCVVPETYAATRLDPVELDGPPVETFPASHDVFGDGSVLVVSLPGHTPGHVGVLLTLRSGRRVLLAGDAAWSAYAVAEARERAPVAACLVDADRDEAYRSVLRLHRLPGDVTVLPAHDLRAIRAAFPAGPLR
ncbi:putative hydrolase [Carbonactinospora thermoautotrophica]|uniref:Putative hydrolase n=2 Tax=Carbonactinospora thermoautotrophica TaxID=1469144 RepID=A0A132MXM1_9ACTN|nr:MBL fold metallo-hydrolase [Carbonactinospora thermoautotrophica]KWX02658.1 putative hydrolase [Carbonactinospora thermoautotrophica]